MGVGMSDYKELVEKLRRPNFAQKVRDEAANAIEQLCTDVARLEAENRAKEQYIAETIGKLARERERDDEIIASLQKELVEAAKERDAYAKCFRIMRTDEPFTNHAVFKVDYKDLICHTEEEIANALVYGFARIINEQRGVQEVEHGNS